MVHMSCFLLFSDYISAVKLISKHAEESRLFILSEDGTQGWLMAVSALHSLCQGAAVTRAGDK